MFPLVFWGAKVLQSYDKMVAIIYTATRPCCLCRYLFEFRRWSFDYTTMYAIFTAFTINHNGSNSKTKLSQTLKNENGTYTSPIEWLGPTEFVGFSEGSYLPETAHRFFGPSKARSNNGSARGSATAVEEGDAELKAIEAGKEEGKRKDNAAKHTQWLGSEGDNFPIYFILYRSSSR